LFPVFAVFTVSAITPAKEMPQGPAGAVYTHTFRQPDRC